MTHSKKNREFHEIFNVKYIQHLNNKISLSLSLSLSPACNAHCSPLSRCSVNNAHCSFPIYCHITEQALLLSGSGDLTIWNLSSPWSTLSLMGCLMLAVSDIFREWCSPLLDFLYERCEELLSPCEVDRVGENSVEVLRDC